MVDWEKVDRFREMVEERYEQFADHKIKSFENEYFAEQNNYAYISFAELMFCFNMYRISFRRFSIGGGSAFQDKDVIDMLNNAYTR